MTTRYKRRPEFPRHDLQGADWQERINSIRAWIFDVVSSPSRALHIGAIWGPRGSGKTSLLKSLFCQGEPPRGLVLPKHDPESKSPVDLPLFTPDLLDDTNGDHLFSHLLTFLNDNYAPLKGERFKEPLSLLTSHRHFDEFKSFEQETAASAEKLHKALLERLRTRATFSTRLRSALRESLEGTNYYLVLIDDIDLVPHRGPELLRLLHTYLRDLPLIVLLTADRGQLVEHTALELGKLHSHPDRSLAVQTLAKQIPFEWHVPLPSRPRVIDDFYDRTKRRRASNALLGKRVTDAFNDAANVLRGGWSRYSQGEGAPAPWGKEPTDYVGRFLAPNWRAINRAYNRLATLVEELDASAEAREKLRKAEEPDAGEDAERNHGEEAELHAHEDAQKTLSERLSIREELLIPFLAIFTALDAHLPELALQEALQLDPTGLRRSLGDHVAQDDHDSSTPPNERLVDSEDPAEVRDGRSHDREDNSVDAPYDRLKPPWLDGRRIPYARSLLRDFAVFWDILSSANTYVRSRVVTVYAISVDTDALAEIKKLEDTLDDLFPDTDKVQLRHIDKFGGRSLNSPRPGAAELREFTEDPALLEELATIIEEVAIYPRAPLSFVAWIGWHLRQRLELDQVVVLGVYAGLVTPYSVGAAEIALDTDEALLLQQPFPLSLPTQKPDDPSPEGARPGEALVVLDIRPKPDSSGRSLPLWGLNGEPVRPEHRLKLASNPGFKITPDNLPELLADVVWLFRDLRDKLDVTRFHLALATSAPLAFFIGRELHSFIPVDLYEHDPATSSYRFVTTLM